MGVRRRYPLPRPCQGRIDEGTSDDIVFRSWLRGRTSLLYRGWCQRSGSRGSRHLGIGVASKFCIGSSGGIGSVLRSMRAEGGVWRTVKIGELEWRMRDRPVERRIGESDGE